MLSVKLEQQPFEATLRVVDVEGIVNSDPNTQCLHRACYVQETYDLDVQWGTLLVWDKKKKVFDPFWGYHSWNINDDDTIIYDRIT